MQKIKVGPILGVESDTQYTVCFSTDKNVAETQWVIDGKRSLVRKWVIPGRLQYGKQLIK